jgi:hypothetical protein
MIRLFYTANQKREEWSLSPTLPDISANAISALNGGGISSTAVHSLNYDREKCIETDLLPPGGHM